MIDHIGIDIKDAETSKKFYTKALAPIGYSMTQVPTEYTGGKIILGYGNPPEKADFWISEGNGKATHPPMHVAFRVQNRKQVDEFYAAAIAAGGKDNGAPGLRAKYHKDYYAAFVFDPDGHNVEVVCHEPG